MNSNSFVSRNRLSRDTMALVLAGGRGKRLKDLTLNTAKPSLPFAGQYRIIDFTLSNCINSGIRRVGVLTQYKSSELNFHLQRAWGHLRWEYGEYVGLLPAQQQNGESWYQGTADAVFQNLELLRSHGCKRILILSGDHVYKMDYGEMLSAHIESGAKITVASVEVPIKGAHGFGVMELDKDNNIQTFIEKPIKPGQYSRDGKSVHTSMGIYIFDFEVLEALLMSDAGNPFSRHDFGFDVLPAALKKYKTKAYIFSSAHSDVQPYWRDVGTIDEYYNANMDLVSVDPELNLYDKSWPIYTYQQQLPGAKFVFNNEGMRGIAADSVVGPGSIISGATIASSLLSSEVKVDCSTHVHESVLLPNVEIGKHCYLYRSLIAEGCKIPDNTVIGADAELDKQRFYVSESGIVLVTPGMLKKLAQPENQQTELPLDNSLMA